jgi:hypothetical protein
MAERFKAPVLKTDVGKPTGGSNPSPSASDIIVSERTSALALSPMRSSWHRNLNTYGCGFATGKLHGVLPYIGGFDAAHL